eukprot:624508-Prymnesium_polylepis.5
MVEHGTQQAPETLPVDGVRLGRLEAVEDRACADCIKQMKCSACRRSRRAAAHLLASAQQACMPSAHACMGL